jgi:type I restriction enzyme R subunit
MKQEHSSVMVNESQIEYGLIGELTKLKYTYNADIRDWRSLEDNFRKKFEALNCVQLSDAEFQRLRDEIVTPDPFTAAKTLRQPQVFAREDGTPLPYTLVNIKDWCKNDFEVAQQVRINTAISHHRYDVVLLLNGLPVVQIELKTRGVSERRAVQQIVDYKTDPGNGYGNTLMCFVQLFVVSNHDRTFYFANNRLQHLQFAADEPFLPVYRYADTDNTPVDGLFAFAQKFLAKCTLAKTISRYMVLVETEQRLLVMRPYQVYAVEAIVKCVEQNLGNGYIWHTTGSGKTLTSFKASTLLKSNPDIEKCLFVVDRKDLDRQTREEFNRFQEGCVEENTNTETLVRRLLSTDYADKVIVTTIQKLGIAFDRQDYKARLAPLRDQRVVFIFDECHRSQFGENHKSIKDFFPRAQLFGFTGTPIFRQNASYMRVIDEQASLAITEDIFQKKLHAYTITHAIGDANVLRFHVDYYKAAGPNPPAAGEGIGRGNVVRTILDKHDAATHERRFNALLATASINDAIAYYQLFQEEQARRTVADPNYRPLQVACVFSPPPLPLGEVDARERQNAADVRQLQDELTQEREDVKIDPIGKRAALAAIIEDYARHYGTAHTVAEFDAYYQDVQQRIKNQQWPLSDFKQEEREAQRKQRVDVTIVVDMLLTGFDSKYLNTLYVDKKMRFHSLIQAFSRTNRVLNRTKPAGNILDFRQQQAAVDEAIELFSGVRNLEEARKIWLVEPVPVMLDKYEKAVTALTDFLAQRQLAPAPAEVGKLHSDFDKAQFVEAFKEVQQLRTRLDQYTDLTPAQEQQLEALLPLGDLRGFRGQYLELANELRYKQGKGRPDSDPVEQVDLELVLFASALIDYDYIMGLMAASTMATPQREQLDREQVIERLMASATLLDDAAALRAYFRDLPANRAYTVDELKAGFADFKQQEEAKELARIAATYGLKPTELTSFVARTLDRMILDGDELRELFGDLGWKARTAQELALMRTLDGLGTFLKKKAQGRDISGLSAYETV